MQVGFRPPRAPRRPWKGVLVYGLSLVLVGCSAIAPGPTPAGTAMTGPEVTVVPIASAPPGPGRIPGSLTATAITPTSFLPAPSLSPTAGPSPPAVDPPTPPAAPSPTALGGGLPRPDHVVIVMEENHGYSQIIGASAAPYINQLAAQGVLLRNSHGVTHPSQPNYLALFSGSTQGITGDSCPHTFRTPNLASALLNAEYSFTGYAEDLPAAGSAVCTSDSYARKHSPWVNFANVPASANQPFSAFPADYRTLPTVAFVIPNLDNDMHNGTVARADTWLRAHLDGYVTWAADHNSLLIVQWDEDDDGADNHIPTILVGAHVQARPSDQAATHYTLLRTLETLYGLPLLGNSADASLLQDIWVP